MVRFQPITAQGREGKVRFQPITSQVGVAAIPQCLLLKCASLSQLAVVLQTCI